MYLLEPEQLHKHCWKQGTEVQAQTLLVIDTKRDDPVRAHWQDVFDRWAAFSKVLNKKQRERLLMPLRITVNRERSVLYVDFEAVAADLS